MWEGLSWIRPHDLGSEVISDGWIMDIASVMIPVVRTVLVVVELSIVTLACLVALLSFT